MRQIVCSTTTESCNEPASFGHMDSRLYSSTIFWQSYSLLPLPSNFANNLDTVPESFVNISYEYIPGYGHGSCISQHSHHRSRSFRRTSLNQLSSCPWEYVKNIDNNRQPNEIVESVCKCSSPANAPDQSCYPVTQYINVFRRVGCEFGSYVYSNVWEPVRVACVAGISLPSTGLDTERKMRE